MNNYPFVRVLLVFLLSPVIGGVLLGGFLLFPACHQEYIFADAELSMLQSLWLHSLWMVLTGTAAVAYQLVPVLILALICISTRLQKGWLGCFCISIGSGLLTLAWDYIVNGRPYGSFSPEIMVVFLAWGPLGKSLILGMFCTGLAAFFSLPPRDLYSHGKV